MVRKTRKQTRMAVKPKQKKTTKSEVTEIGKLLRSIGGIGGGALGSTFGNPTAGSALGTLAGAGLSKWLGYGDYAINKNSLVKGSDSVPMMHNAGQSIIVRHREFIGDVISGTGTPTAFNIHGEFVLNPGLAASFPWLSTVAQNFVEYTWKGVVFHYVPTSGASVASTNTGLGSVMMATNYRATAPAYVNKQVMLNEFFASDARPSEPFLHPIECDPRENPYNVQYVRIGSVPAGEDQKTYDLGVTTVATVGCPATAINLGELWVSYEVELRKPKAIGLSQGDAYFYREIRLTPSTSSYMGTAGTPSNTDIDMTASTINWAKHLTGTFLVLLSYANGNSTTQISIPTVTLTNGVFNMAVIAHQGQTITGGAGFNTVMFAATSTDVAAGMIATMSGPFPVAAGTSNTCVVRIIQVNNIFY